MVASAFPRDEPSAIVVAMQLVWRGCLLLAVALAACGDDGGDHQSGDAATADAADPNDGARSGTRMKLAWRDWGGTRELVGMFDAQRNEACAVTKWNDDKRYCTPTNTMPARYADDQCSQPIGIQTYDPSCAPPTPAAYIVESVQRACPSLANLPTKIYARGDKITVTTYYQRDGAQCIPVTSSNTDFYAVGAEIPVASFAEFTRGAPEGAGRLARQFMTTTDGARVFDVPRDQTLGVDCTLRQDYFDAPTGSCVPAGTSLARYFHDSQCTAAQVDGLTACAKPAFAQQPINASCPEPTFRYFTVGAAVTSSPLFVRTDISCSATTASSDRTFYAIDAPIEGLPLTRAPDAEPGRTVQLVHYSDGKTRTRDVQLRDTGHGTNCAAFPQTDGTIRCVPIGGNVQSLYSDSNCTTAIDVVQIRAGIDPTCGAPHLPKFATKSISTPGQCGFQLELYEVGAKVAPLYQNTGTCTLVNLPGVEFYKVGALHPIAEFPSATVGHDS